MTVNVKPGVFIHILFKTGATLQFLITEIPKLKEAKEDDLSMIEVINTSKGIGFMWPRLDFFMVYLTDLIPFSPNA